MDDLRILDTWVAGYRRPAARRLVMLAAAYPELPDRRLAELPVGYANRLLLRDRQSRFGATVEGEAVCPGCQQRLEVSVDLAELLAGDAPAEPPESVETEAVGEVRVGELVARFRLASAGDLAAVADCADPAEASRRLLRRCLQEARRGTEPVDPDRLPAELLSALDAELARRDSLADLRLSITCAGCRHGFELVLDPAALYWAELAERACRLLFEVHRLARAYGWTESEILGIHPARRAAYLELAG